MAGRVSSYQAKSLHGDKVLIWWKKIKELMQLGKYEAIIVELKALFVLNDTFITFSGDSHHKNSHNYAKWCQLSPLIP